MATRIDNQPIELLELIFRELATEDVCSLRLTNRRLGNRIRQHFNKHCFATVGSSLIGKSFANLECIANHPDLGAQVGSLHIRNNAILPPPTNQHSTWRFASDSFVEVERLKTAALHSLLSNSLPNCRRLRIYDKLTDGGTVASFNTAILSKAIISGCGRSVTSIKVSNESRSTSMMTLQIAKLRQGIQVAQGCEWDNLKAILLEVCNPFFDIKNTGWLSDVLKRNPPVDYLGICLGDIDKPNTLYLEDFSEYMRGLPRLNTLKLKNLVADIETIDQLLFQSSSTHLTRLKFTGVWMRAPDTWQSALVRLAGSCPLLQSAHLENIYERNDSEDAKIDFDLLLDRWDPDAQDDRIAVTTYRSKWRGQEKAYGISIEGFEATSALPEVAASMQYCPFQSFVRGWWPIFHDTHINSRLA